MPKKKKMTAKQEADAYRRLAAKYNQALVDIRTVIAMWCDPGKALEIANSILDRHKIVNPNLIMYKVESREPNK